LFTGFAAVNFPGSILYRKRPPEELAQAHEPSFSSEPVLFPPLAPNTALSEPQVDQVLSPVPTPAALPVEHAPVKLADAQELYDRGEYAAATVALRAALARPRETPEQLRGLGLLTRALANQGLLDEALAASERWLAADKLDATAHYLHAMVLQEQGDRGGSRAALQRAVYLQPEFTLAHFALGNHARAEARAGEARRHFANAAQLLHGLPADEPVPESEGLTAGRLREIITALGSDS
jgi:chemotaxis protein methyltransferase CheR